MDVLVFEQQWNLLKKLHQYKHNFHSTSDDNLLKNIELFDKMSLRFSGRVLFIKDVIGSSEICCWTFYGHGRKVAEVCCHSIVYTTDKKHTKVISCKQWYTWSSVDLMITANNAPSRLNSPRLGYMRKH